MEFAKKLQKLRKQNNLTQEELSKKLYVSRTAVSKWESGKGYPNIDSLKDISKIFKISIDELLSCDEIIDIAKQEKDLNNKKLNNLFYGLLDIVGVLLIFLPLYPYTVGNFVYSVSLIGQNDINSIVKISYIIILSILSLIGIIEIAYYFISNLKMQKFTVFISLCYQMSILIYFVVTRQIYVSLIMLLLLIIKMVIVTKDLISTYKCTNLKDDTKSVVRNS